MRKKTLLYIFFAGLSVLLIAGFVLRQQFYGNAVKTERELFVSSRADYRALVDSLLPELKHHWAFGVYARRINLAETFKPGHYLLERGMSVIRVARMLKLGMQTPVRVTINNVRIPAQLAQKLAGQIDADSAAIMRALTSDEVARKAGFDSLTLFSMFIPNTYEQFVLDFVKSSGSLKEMAHKLGLSYPTVRNRLDDIISQLNKFESDEQDS